MRIRGIDLFRGLSIVLMVFFSIIVRLSDKLPDVLEHNIDTLHFGDFVLPMFLFASGMSLVFYAKKREGTKYILDIVERFGKLLLISFFLTPFTVGTFLGMDEVMLSLVLFIPTLFLIRYSDKVIAAAGVLIFLLYFGLSSMNLLPDFSNYYLGGYDGALFYLPVMLGGAIAGKNIERVEKLVVPSVLLTAVLLLIIPPYKMVVSPSFMALSVSFSLVVYLLIRNLDIRPIEYLGKRPLYYWIMMWFVLLIPLMFVFIGEELPLGFEWQQAVVVALAAMIVLYYTERGFSYIVSLSRKAARPM